MSRRGRDYKKKVQARLQELILTGKITSFEDQKLSVAIACHAPDKRKRDLDNILKPVLDACQGWIFDDDSQIENLFVKRMAQKAYGFIIIEINSIID